MFTAIAPRYDLLNHLLSLNIDRYWRKAAVDRLDWERFPRGDYLDLCAGTLDLAVELHRRDGFGGRVVGADFVIPMLKLGRGKAPVTPVGADAMKLPFGNALFDGCTIGFGVRNLADISDGLREIARVLKPDARIAILELSTPTFLPLRLFYMLYFKRLLPLIGRLVSRHQSAYSYLPESVLQFPSPDGLVRIMEDAGFTDVHYERFSGGIVAIHTGRRA